MKYDSLSVVFWNAKPYIKKGIFTLPLLYASFILLFCTINVLSLLYFDIAYLLMKNFVLFFNLILIIRSYRNNGILSIYSLFISFCLFFLYARIFFDLIGYRPLTYYNFGKRITWNENVIYQFLHYSFIFLIAIDFSYYISKPKKIANKKFIENKSSKRVTYFFFFFFLLIFSYKCYLDIQAIHSMGYTAIISEIRINYPFWTKASGTLFYISFYMLLMHKLSKKETIIIFFLYAIVSALSGLKGARAAFFLPIVFSLFYLSKKQYIKITISKLTMLVCLAIVFIFIITFSRGESLDHIKSFKDIFYYVFYNQTQTFNLPIFYLEHKHFCQENRSIPYIFSDTLHIYNSFFSTGSNVIHKFTGLPNGMGLGESLFLELLDLHFIYSIIFCLYIGYIIKFVECNFFRNRTLLPIFCCFVSSAFYMPRNTMFSFLDSSSVIYFIATNFIILILTNFIYYSYFRKS